MREAGRTYELGLRAQLRGRAPAARGPVRERRVVDARPQRDGGGVEYDARRRAGRARCGDEGGEEQLREVEVAEDVRAEMKVIVLARERGDRGRCDRTIGIM